MNDNEAKLNLAANGAGSDLTVFYSNALNKIFLENYDKIKANVLKRTTKELKEWISRIFTYQFDFKNISFENLSETQNGFIEEYNFKNRMVNQHLIASRLKVDLGSVALALRIGNKKPLTEVLEITSTPKWNQGEVVELFATKNNISQRNEQTWITFYHFYKNKDGVFVDTYETNYADENSKQNFIIENSEKIGSYEYDRLDYLPVEIFVGNESSMPEWKYVESSIDMASKFTEQLVTEWSYIRTQLINNLQYNPEKTSKDIKKDIEEKDERIHDVYDPDGSLQQALSYLSSGSVTADIARAIVNHFKDQIREQIFMISKASGGNNKHNTEALAENVNAFSYIWQRKTLTSESIARFYFMLLDIMKKYGYQKVGELPSYLKGEVQLSRPLEVLMNLNADSKEKDNEVQEFIQRKEEVKDVDSK